MFKLARSRQVASAFKAAKVRRDMRGLQQDEMADQLQDTPIRRAAFQQTRNLSIHEYRSAQLLDSVRRLWVLTKVGRRLTEGSTALVSRRAMSLTAGRRLRRLPRALVGGIIDGYMGECADRTQRATTW